MEQANLTDTRRSADEKIRLNAFGRKWLMAFFSAIRTAQIHDPKNQIFDEPFSFLIQTGDELLSTEARIDFRIIEEQFFLNGLWIKPTLTEKETLFDLAEHFLKIGLGGVMVRASTSVEEWRKFLSIYKIFKFQKDQIVDQMNHALVSAGIEQIEVRGIFNLQEEKIEDKPLPTISYGAVRAYAKILLTLKEFPHCSTNDERVENLRKAQRVICELVDLSEKTPRLFCLLSLLKYVDSYFYHHCVNVMVLSLALARQVSLDRKELVDTGMASLYHDVGKLLIPEEILSKSDDLTEEEWTKVRKHPIDSARIFLTLGYLNQGVAERILVAYQHHWVSKTPEAYPNPKRNMVPSLVANIVSICVGYDSLVTHKRYRRAHAPFQVARILWSQTQRGGYRSELMKTFLRMIGPLPFGSWVRMPNGKEGLVVASGLYAPKPPFPLLFVYDDKRAMGEWIDSSETVEGNETTLSLAPKYVDPVLYQRTLGTALRLGNNVIY